MTSKRKRIAIFAAYEKKEFVKKIIKKLTFGKVS